MTYINLVSEDGSEDEYVCFLVTFVHHLEGQLETSTVVVISETVKEAALEGYAHLREVFSHCDDGRFTTIEKMTVEQVSLFAIKHVVKAVE